MSLLEIIKNHNPYDTKVVPPYIISEIGVNHEGSMELAKRLIDESKLGGAHAVKFQSYKAETLSSKNSPAYWDMTKESTPSQYELFKKHDKFWKKEFVELKKYCDQVGIEFLSTPFDIESAIFLNELMPVFKISSSDITNKPFIEYLCDFQKPIILSTGASELYEIQEAVSWIAAKGNSLSLLHCVLNYPTPDEDAHLSRINGLRKHFPEHLIGYSDHTLPKDMEVMKVATLLGARIIEKHFTHDKTLPGNDHYHAMDYKDLIFFHEKMKGIYKVLGNSDVIAHKRESLAIKNARRSLVLKRNVKSGTIITKEDLTFKRPAHGVSPRFIDDVIGMKANKNLSEDDILSWKDLDS